jgi:4-hydroxy-3-methylbut-2-enyl diphosphate reductase
MKSFPIPVQYKSPLITAIKNRRKQQDKMKRDFSPSLLDFGGIRIFLARHFGFCYGVENAIDISFRTVEEHPGRRIFLLSEMIHNPLVNQGLTDKGIRFLQDTHGRQLIAFEELRPDDIVITPAFGTTLDIERLLRAKGISLEKYDTTCPFVEKVWNRSEQIASRGYTVIVHGKPLHEETRATFSHAAAKTPSLVVEDLQEAGVLARYITGEEAAGSFYLRFEGRFSPGFDAERDLVRIGVVNQTTMLAADTLEISSLLKLAIIRRYALTPDRVDEHFADTRDTLCYATNDNQSAVQALTPGMADLAIVVGGYNSSNTSHLVELCEQRCPTYFVQSADNLISEGEILHYDLGSKRELLTRNYLPEGRPVRLFLTGGASCPDSVVEGVIQKLTHFFPSSVTLDQVQAAYDNAGPLS